MRNLCALLLLLIIPSVRAANSLMIWPIDPAIASEDKASELWLENRGSSSTIMQVRIFAWQQREGQEQYQTQQQVAASPPMVRLEPGQKQLVRLMNRRRPLPVRRAPIAWYLMKSRRRVSPVIIRPGLTFRCAIPFRCLSTAAV